MDEQTEVVMIHKKADDLLKKEDLMEKLHEMVCKTPSVISSRLKFSNMNQYSDETASKFESRLQGAAEFCSFWVTGKCGECNKEMKLSYKEREVLHQLLKCLYNSDWHQKLLCLEDKNLTRTNG